MPQANWSDYLELLRELSGVLARLTQTQREKTEAVRGDDLAALDDCMKREQALSLSLRGLESKREAAQQALGAGGGNLRKLTSQVPAELRREAAAVEEELRQQYQLYRCAADVARGTLECNLHEIEKVIAAQGGAVPAGPGYQSAAQPDLPGPMKTDFRA